MTTTITNLVCITYQANPYVTAYHFVGKTLEEAQAKLDVFLAPKAVVVEDVEEKDDYIQAGIGRGVANTGKVWMISKEKKIRQRVLPSEVQKYYDMGYVKGGPRTPVD